MGSVNKKYIIALVLVIGFAVSYKLMNPYRQYSGLAYWEKATLPDALKVPDAALKPGNKHGSVLMFAATGVSDPAIITHLISRGADVNEVEPDFLGTPLSAAAAYNSNLEIIRVLMKNGADINARVSDNNTILMTAALFNKTPGIVKELVAQGADINAVNAKGQTALDLAKLTGNSVAIGEINSLLDAETGIKLVKKYYPLLNVKTVDEFAVQNAAYKLTPLGTNIKEVFRITKKAGLGFHNHCFPDSTPLTCQFRTSDGADKYPSYSTTYFFDSNNNLKKISATRWYSGRVRAYSTEDVKPGISRGIVLKKGLSVGQKVKDFENAYGKWSVAEMPLRGWPLTLAFWTKGISAPIQKYNPLLIGVEIGDISRSELHELEKNRERLLELKVGAVF